MTSDLLAEYLREQGQIPFAWGSTDCVHFAGRWYELVTGRDPLGGYSYSSEAEAMELIAEAGSLRSLVSREAGEPQIVRRGGLEIEPGDLVLSTYGSVGEVLGIAAHGAAWYRYAGRRHLIPAPLDQCLCYWRPECRK